MTDHITEANVSSFKQLLIHQSLIDELSGCLIEIATNGKYLQDIHINAVDSMIKAINQLSRRRLDIQNNPLSEPLLDATVQCVCSPFFVNMFKQITELSELNDAQELLLNTCTDYIVCYEGNRRHEIFSIVRTILLKPFTQWLQQHALSFRQWNRITKNSFDKLGGIIFDFGSHNEKIIGKEMYDDCCKIIDSYILILSTLSNNINTMDESTIDLIGICMFHLYALTLEQSLLDYIKSQQLSSILLRLIDIDNEEAQFNAYRILASIMTEQDIKMLANPSKIANVFIKFLTDVIDNARKIRRLRNLLRCLKSLVQHDQIKEELTKQSILPHLCRCATETKFDPVQEQQPTLEILLALTFHNQAAIFLKENSQFISHLHTLINSSTEQGLRRAAEGLIWKLEKEETATAKLVTISMTKGVRNYKYDIMLSYSHRDTDLCHRICDRLVNDNFRVWLDRDQIHGSTMVAMADAIENAEFVFVCMSDAYKQSAYCQSEAHYAYERQCHLIPIVMKQNYRPDGWLGIMVSGKIYVDFPKLGFDQAYLKLKNEIDRHRMNLNLSIRTQEQHRYESPTTVTSERTIETITNQPHEQPTTTKYVTYATNCQTASKR
ncbi:unnamed protein product [Rotaria sp. Silwood2]|nr:unnamed protein product [Rotaria sp. Silwood2]CAF4254835.1 unnamed protein product [Rotaria sp. Silwood2]